mmetsp:Transcript_15625/g.51303  ORF Transcript_15625/g.51303 Transcript_15625/m.51303 type:complete len:257 (+) Transcript_15625:839-1609(+)
MGFTQTVQRSRRATLARSVSRRKFSTREPGLPSIPSPFAAQLKARPRSFPVPSGKTDTGGASLVSSSEYLHTASSAERIQATEPSPPHTAMRRFGTFAKSRSASSGPPCSPGSSHTWSGLSSRRNFLSSAAPCCPPLRALTKTSTGRASDGSGKILYNFEGGTDDSMSSLCRARSSSLLVRRWSRRLTLRRMVPWSFFALFIARSTNRGEGGASLPSPAAPLPTTPMASALSKSDDAASSRSSTHTGGMTTRLLAP